MKTNELLNILKNNPEKELRLEYKPGYYVPGYYHISEIKNCHIDSVDCGGNAHNFNQTVAQIWLPNPKKHYERFTCGKANKIFNIVDNKKPLQHDAVVLIEYGNQKLPTSHYEISNIKEEEERITLKLHIPGPVCKPRLHWEEGELKEEPCC